MTETLSTIVTPSCLELSFTWTPAGTETYTAPNGLVLSAPSAAANTLLTFTAAVTIDGSDLTGPLTITEYRWDFGDGVYGYGNGATHSYKLANFQAATKLRVTDSKGRQWFTRGQMYLT